MFLEKFLNPAQTESFSNGQKSSDIASKLNHNEQSERAGEFRDALTTSINKNNKVHNNQSDSNESESDLFYSEQRNSDQISRESSLEEQQRNEISASIQVDNTSENTHTTKELYAAINAAINSEKLIPNGDTVPKNGNDLPVKIETTLIHQPQEAPAKGTPSKILSNEMSENPLLKDKVSGMQSLTIESPTQPKVVEKANQIEQKTSNLNNDFISNKEQKTTSSNTNLDSLHLLKAQQATVTFNKAVNNEKDKVVTEKVINNLQINTIDKQPSSKGINSDTKVETQAQNETLISSSSNRNQQFIENYINASQVNDNHLAAKVSVNESVNNDNKKAEPNLVSKIESKSKIEAEPKFLSSLSATENPEQSINTDAFAEQKKNSLDVGKLELRSENLVKNIKKDFKVEPKKTENENKFEGKIFNKAENRRSEFTQNQLINGHISRSMTPLIALETATNHTSNPLNPVISEVAATSQTQQQLNQATKVNSANNTLSVSVPTATWNHKFAEHISMLALRGATNAQIRLDPPELGPLTVRINHTGSETLVQFNVSNPIARDLVDSGMNKLREMLEEHGFENVDVDVNEFKKSDRENAEFAEDENDFDIDEQVDELSNNRQSLSENVKSNSLIDLFA